MDTGICRVVMAWCFPMSGDSAASDAHSPARAASSSSCASAVNVWVPTSTVILGWALRLSYQAGLAGDLPLEATIAMRPSGCGLHASGVTRSAPDLAPMWWMRIIGVPASHPPKCPWFARNFSTLALKSLTGSGAAVVIVSAGPQEYSSWRRIQVWNVSNASPSPRSFGTRSRAKCGVYPE